MARARAAKAKRGIKQINQRKKKRSENMVKKIFELSSDCNMDAALFIHDRDSRRWIMAIAADDPEWRPSYSDIVSEPIGLNNPSNGPLDGQQSGSDPH
jgi:hypothetical protein